jgi:uncharacterized membrane protein YeaQ/YmgE (transglycosylase-associated protein family)
MLHNAAGGRKFRPSPETFSARIPQSGKLDRSPAEWSRHISQLWIGSNEARRNVACEQGGVFLMQLSNESILVILFVGLIAGWLAGKIVRGTGFGIIGDILVGIAGALVASLLFPKLGIAIGTGLVREIIYSAIGAVVLLLVVRLLRTGGRF